MIEKTILNSLNDYARLFGFHSESPLKSGERRSEQNDYS